MSNDESMEEMGATAAPVDGGPAADAIVSVYGGLIFATTGQMACYELNATAEQVALTPAVALRIAGVLREALAFGDLEKRQLALQVWTASEMAAMPHGRVLFEEAGVQFGIEPLGAGALVTVQWAYVPGLIASLENAASWLASS